MTTTTTTTTTTTGRDRALAACPPFGVWLPSVRASPACRPSVVRPSPRRDGSTAPTTSSALPERVKPLSMRCGKQRPDDYVFLKNRYPRQSSPAAAMGACGGALPEQLPRAHPGRPPHAPPVQRGHNAPTTLGRLKSAQGLYLTGNKEPAQRISRWHKAA